MVMHKAFRADSPSLYCPECIEPCYVTKYSALLTYRKFPVFNELSYYQKMLNTSLNLTQFRKSFLAVDFSFDSMTRLTVVEMQAITIEDLLKYIGGVIGLFMGMSFMSFGEILHLLLEMAVHFWFKLFIAIKGVKKKSRSVSSQRRILNGKGKKRRKGNRILPVIHV